MSVHIHIQCLCVYSTSMHRVAKIPMALNFTQIKSVIIFRFITVLTFLRFSVSRESVV